MKYSNPLLLYKFFNMSARDFEEHEIIFDE